jgi:hypothetical protein
MKRNDSKYDARSAHGRGIMKTAAAGTLLALLLAGCSGQNPVKTQPISSMESSEGGKAETSQDDISLTAPSQADVLAENASLPSEEESYYKVKAELDAIDIDIENLEADYRIGKLSREDFTAQKSQLEAQENSLEQEKDQLEDSMDLAYLQSNPSVPSGSLDELRSAKAELEKKERQLEAQEDSLERSYQAGEISREDFITQQIEIIRSEESIDREDDLLEQAMEAMGFDD